MPPQAHSGGLQFRTTGNSMSDNFSKTNPRAMKGNHRSSGKGAEMERTVYEDDGRSIISSSAGKNVVRIVLLALVALVVGAGVLYFVI